MTSEVNLLTEAEARAIYLAATSPEDFNTRLRERGLIAPEPVDPLLEEAEVLHQEWVAGKHGEHGDTIDLALAALRRGMELRPPLTREAVEAAVMTIPYEVFETQSRDKIADRLHDALTDGGRDA